MPGIALGLKLGRSSVGSGYTAADPDVADWQQRIEANGGTVSFSTLRAHEEFVEAAKAADYWDDLDRTQSLFGNDLVACLTPLKVGSGDASDTSDFVAGDYSPTTGLQGNGTKKLGTTISPADLTQNTNFFAVYVLQDAGQGTARNLFGVGLAESNAWHCGIGSSANPSSPFSRNNSSTSRALSFNPLESLSFAGFIGTLRTSSTNVSTLCNSESSFISTTSAAPSTTEIEVFRRNSGTPGPFAGRIGGYVSASQPFTMLKYAALRRDWGRLQSKLGRGQTVGQLLDFKEEVATHIPQFEVLPDGTIILCYMKTPGAHGAALNQIWEVRSPDNGFTWSSPREIVAATANRSHQPAGFLQRSNGELWLIMHSIHTNETGVRTLRYFVSTDGGLTYGAENTFGAFTNYAAVGKMRELTSGRLGIAAYIVGTGNVRTVHYLYSDDDGDNWSKVDLNQSGEENLSEPTLVEWDGGLLMLIRHPSSGKIWYSWSTDEGITWSAAATTNINSPNSTGSGTNGSRAMAETLPDGRLAIAHNNALTRITASLTVCSARSGGTFTIDSTVNHTPMFLAQTQYPNLAVSQGKVHFAWSWENTTFSEMWVKTIDIPT